jgi:hypothetical protein
MSSLTILGDTSGSVVLQAPAVSGSTTLTLPAATGTVMVSGNMPAFSAYLNANQSVSSATWTKIQINTKEWDTATCFSTSTYRFTPNVAGYYQFNGNTSNASGGGARVILALYKNGSLARFGNDLGLPSGNWASGISPIVSAQIYCNGTTDYVELYLYDSGGQTVNGGNAGATSYFQGYLTRSA